MSTRHPYLPRRLRFAIVATAIAAGAVALVVPTLGQAVATVAPANTVEPRITGTPTVGSTIMASTGDWSGSPTSYAFEWRRCPTGGGAADASNCDRISGATAATYTLRQADAGTRLRVRVTAANADGSTLATSNASAVVRDPADGAPANTTLPAVSGTPRVGATLRATTGAWSGRQPLTYSFQWLRCDGAGNNCLTLPNAGDDAYLVREGDAGRTLRARVQATNTVGNARALSNPTGTVAGAAGPEGAIRLENGETSIPVSSVPANERLVVDRVEFAPAVVQSRTAPIGVRIKVKDTRGFVVRDAIVFIRSTPVVTAGGDDRRTGQDGWLDYSLTPERDFPALDPRYAVQFFVKAYRAGDPSLAGVAGTRLVQVQLGR